MNLEAIILSAGQSSRMGQTKALLRWRQNTFLEHVHTALKDSGVCPQQKIITGNDVENITIEARRLGLATVHNPNFATGLMSSLQTAVRALNESTDVLLVTTVDLPQLDPLLVRQLVNQFEQQSYFSLARVIYGETPGHPCLIAREHFAAILERPLSDEGANFLFKSLPERTLRFVVRESLRDIDTHDDYLDLNRSN